MKALVFNQSLSLADVPVPVRKAGEVRIRVSQAGICNTDHEIIKGYMGFTGIPGHEFVGFVEDAQDRSLIGARVTAEINCACGTCEWCAKGLGRHCPDRTVIGIAGHQGAFAEYISVPRENLVVIPDGLRMSEAIFIEPLAAALEIFEQIDFDKSKTVLLLGDGKLAQLIGRVLSFHGISSTVLGKHREKLLLLDLPQVTPVLLDSFHPRGFDIVIEATGSAEGFQCALQCVKPRGTLVLKSTYAQGFSFNPASLVVNEITMMGSRCGRFDAAIEFLEKYHPDFSPLITAHVPLQDALQAFELSSRRTSMKVIIDM